jgi:heme A synthase
MTLPRLPGLGAEDGPSISEAARSLRTGAWGMVSLAGLALVLVFAGARRWVPRETIGSALLLFLGASLGAVWLGYKAHRRAVSDRERTSSQAMIVLLAVQLGKLDDATLTRIGGQGGPAGEAARMLLKGRRGEQGGVAKPRGLR